MKKNLRRILATVFPQFRNQLIEQVGGEIARECRAGLWQSVRRQVATMGIPEARGYVRAQASWFVPTAVGPTLDRYALKPTLRAEVLASGVEQLIAMLVREALSEAVAADNEADVLAA
jgi:hypothetical protein